MPPPDTSPATWDQELNRRLRTLLRTVPLHRLEDSKALRDGDLSMHDLRALALRALDAIIEQMGLGRGADREDIRAALRPMVRAAEPGAGEERLAELTDLVLDGLLNEAGRRAAFCEPYASVEGEHLTLRQLSFHLVREEEDPDGGVVLRATAEGVNVYAGMLDYDVEDAQAAEEAVLRAQIRRGRIAEAVATARRARTRSIEYQQKLLAILQTTRRDVSQVDWVQHVLGMLSEAQVHLTERLEVEQELLAVIEDRLDGEPGEAGPQLVELGDTLRECIQRHLGLQRRLIIANQQYLDEQERQAFRPRSLTPLPDLEAQVLRAALELPVGALEPCADGLLTSFHAPRVPALLFLPQLVDRLLAPRRNTREDALPEVPVELEQVSTDLRRFTSADHAAVSSLLASAGDTRLSVLLERGAALSPEVRALLVLTVLQAWDPPEDDPLVSVQALAVPLSHPEFGGEDLRVTARSDR